MIVSRYTWPRIGLIISLICIYLLPNDFLDSIGIPIASILLGLYFMVSMVLILVRAEIRLTILEMAYLLLILACCIYQRSVNPIILLTPVVIGRYYKESTYEQLTDFLLHTKLIHVCLLATIVYSYVYGRKTGIFLHTGVNEVNVSGLSVLLLGLIYLKRNRFIGYSVLLFGLLSLSRNYILSLIIMLALYYKNKHIKTGIARDCHCHFFIILVSTAVVLYGFGLIAQFKYLNNQIVYETTLMGRIKNFFDASNYLRFTVFVLLINVFIESPIYWIVGCKSGDFITLCHDYAKRNGFWYRGNNPHNFIYSYIKLFGIAGLLDVYMVSKLLDSVIDSNNKCIYYGLLLYPIFLSVGFNGEYLVLAYSVLVLYKSDNGIKYAFKS